MCARISFILIAALYEMMIGCVCVKPVSVNTASVVEFEGPLFSLFAQRTPIFTWVLRKAWAL